MVTLSTRLSMIALGVQGDSPPVAVQPPLADGVHLRWAFERELGFPWHGFFLYRRASADIERTCLAYGFRDLVTVPPSTVGNIGLDELSSDQPLVVTDDFPAPGRVELDLGRFGDRDRTWLRLAVHPGEVAVTVSGEIGFRGEDVKPRCVDLSIPDRTLDGLVIEAKNPPVPGRGVDVAGGATIRFKPLCDEVRLTFDGVGPGVTAAATDEAGRTVAKGTTTGGPTIVLAAGTPIARVELRPRTATDKPIVLREVCRVVSSRGRRTIELTGRHRGVPVASAIISGRPGEVVPFTMSADAIDEATFTGPGGGPLPSAALVELCYTPLLLTASLRWEALAGPIALPLTHPDYPASGSRPEDEVAARAEADGRIRYPAPATFGDPEFADLHGSLVALVEGGPASPPMADPSRAPSFVAAPINPSGKAVPTMPAQHPLDLVLLTAIHPAMAQMLGLYRLDDTALPGTAYDYLLLADTGGVSGGDAKKALSAWQQNVAGIEAAIVSNVVAGPLTPLPQPRDVRAYALPGGTIAAPTGPISLAGSVGLRWELPESGGVLLPRSAVAYHLWRDAQGDAASPVPGGGLGDQLTEAGATLVAEPVLDPFHPIQWPPQWPAKAMYRVDPVTDEGWYGYQVSGTDLFGRISPPSGPARWYQWAPAPSPRPWYYTDPAAESVVHPSAVRILDKLPPPAPAGVEASALDPLDPHVLRDAAYTAWRDSLPAGERDSVVGLRVSWRWTDAQRAQAPDTAEFRIYWNTPLPTPDTGDALNWAERLHVTPIADGVAEPGGLRFLVFLPLADTRLTPTLADPVVYAHVGVSAADAVPHTPDAAKWAAGAWGGRAGNEGRAGGPAKIFRVRRVPPPAPVVPPDSERVYATPADYAGKSYYTFRWTPSANLTTHVFRALDESVFLADRRARPRGPLTAADFPPEWSQAKRDQVSTELAALNGFPDTDEGRAAALAAYRALSNDGLRVLAGLPGTERAFTQLTTEPLNPNAPETANRVGPDNPPDHPVDPALRIYVDELDGRARNRYFYRAAHVDGAQNRGPLSRSGPPVWLPKVTAPRTPTLRAISGGESTITLRWASNREPDLAEYRIYRAGDELTARDPRSMTLVHTETVADGDRPGQVEWADSPVPAQTTLWYRIAAVDDAGNVSAPTKAVAARAFRSVPPAAPEWAAAAWNPGGTAVHLEWTFLETGLRPMVQRQRDGSPAWVAVSGWLDPDTAAFDDSPSTSDGHFYRVLVRDPTGNVSPTAPAQYIPPFGP